MSEADQWNQKGVAYYEKGNIQQASICFSRAYQLDTENSETLYNLGTVYVANKDYSNALWAFNRSIYYDLGNSAKAKSSRDALLRQGYK